MFELHDANVIPPSWRWQGCIFSVTRFCDDWNCIDLFHFFRHKKKPSTHIIVCGTSFIHSRVCLPWNLSSEMSSLLPRIFWRRGQLSGQFIHPRLGDEQRMLELGRGKTIRRGRRPLVWPHYILVCAQAYHGLDRECVPRGHHPTAVIILVPTQEAMMKKNERMCVCVWARVKGGSKRMNW